jgi:hypothetical protein
LEGIAVELKTVKIENPDELNMILGQAHFIKTADDLHEALVSAVPTIKFGVAFCEASGPRLVRFTGNDDGLIELAKKNALTLSCGHCFVIFMKDAFPINIMNAIREVPEVVGVFCATANPVEVVIAETELGRGIMGVIDGMTSLGAENEDDQKARRGFLKEIGYKL